MVVTTRRSTGVERSVAVRAEGDHVLELPTAWAMLGASLTRVAAMLALPILGATRGTGLVVAHPANRTSWAIRSSHSDAGIDGRAVS